jgi:hypothetical protein
MKHALLALALLCACDPLAGDDLAVRLRVDAVTPSLLPTRGGTVVSVIGANFDPGVTVTIDDTPVQLVTRHDAGRLTFVSPPLPDTGTCELVVANPDGGRAVRPCQAFAAEVRLEDDTLLVPTDGRPDFVTGDVDGDGDQDLVVHAERLVRVARNDGQGWFDDGPAAALDDDERLLLAADLDGDGQADLVTTLGVRAGAADGSLGPRADFGHALDGNPPVALTGDFDGDGLRELVAVQVDDILGHPPFQIVYRFADGLLTELDLRVDLAVSPRHDGRPEPPAVGDLDGDGRDDLAFVGPDERLHVAFGPELDPATGWSLEIPGAPPGQWVVRALDWSGDGLLDLLVHDSYFGADLQLVVLGTGTRDLGPVEDLGDPCPAGPVTAVLPGTTLDTVTISGVQCADGSTRLTRDGEITIYDGAVGDGARLAFLDDDGFPDLAHTTGAGVVARFGSFGRELLSHRTLAIGDRDLDRLSWTQHVTTGRFGADHAFAGAATDHLVRYTPGRPPAAGDALPLPGGRTIGGLWACDVDGDGTDELVAEAMAADFATELALVTTGATLALADEVTLARGNVVLFPGDRKRQGLVHAGPIDGAPCALLSLLLEYLPDEQRVVVRAGTLWRGSPLAASPVTIDVELSASEHLVSGDFDGDGDLDLLRVGLPGRALLLLGAGRAFTPHPLDLVEHAVAAQAVVVSGHAELWLVELGGGGALVRLSLDASGQATPLGRVPLPASRDMDLTIGDLDGDTLADALVHDRLAGSVVLITSGAAAQLTVAAVQPVERPRWLGGAFDELVLVDWSGDGLADVVGTSRWQPERLVLWQNTSQ